MNASRRRRELAESVLHSDPKKQASSVEITNFAPNSREKIAKFPKIFGAPRAEKLHKFGQRDRTNCRTSLQLFCESLCVLMQDNARVQRRDDAKFAQKSRENFCNISGNPARPAHKNCVQSASVRCTYFTTSLRVDRVRIAFRSEKSKRPASGSHKFYAQLARKNREVSENFRRAARRKVA